jgi:hypothetical protein
MLTILPYVVIYLIVLIMIYAVYRKFYPPRQTERERHEASDFYIRNLHE